MTLNDLQMFPKRPRPFHSCINLTKRYPLEIFPEISGISPLEKLENYTRTADSIRLGTAPGNTIHPGGLHVSVKLTTRIYISVKIQYYVLFQITLLLVKFVKHNQNYYLKLDVSTSITGLCQKKLVLSSSVLVAIHIRKEGQQAMNRDDGSYQLSHAYDRFLDMASSRRNNFGCVRWI